MPKIGKINYGNLSSFVDDNKFYETDSSYPPIVKTQKTIIFSQSFTLNNDGVTNSMKVNGSTTPQKFIIQSNSENDVYISSISFIITADLTTTELGEFGGTTPLTNGCKFFLETSEDGEVIINDSLKTNYDLVRMAVGNPNPGVGPGTEFKIGNVFSNSDEGFLIVLKFSDYGYDREYTGGILLRKQTNDRLVFEIRDNLNLATSSIATFNAIAYGYKRIN